MKENIIIDLQLACENQNDIPSIEDFQYWVYNALKLEQKGQEPKHTELSIRIVDMEESQFLNNTYRGKDYPTNVISFPFEAPEHIELPLLGDLVICKDVLIKEANEQKISLIEHFAHLTVHGSLHLLGYDHIIDEEAEVMEGLETQIMIAMGFNDPYLSEKE